jgi:hypothetical protein
MLPSLIGSTKPDRYLDKLAAAHFETVSLFGQNVAISGLKDTVIVLASFPMTLIPCV